MFIEPTILSIFISKIRGGKIREIENVNIKGWYFFIISGILQLVLSLIKKTNSLLGDKIITDYFIYLIIISYILIIVPVISNINKNYMKIFLIGIILNFIVIAGNGGSMPVSLEGIKGIHRESILEDREFDIKHTAVTSGTRFVYLADIILIPRPYPLPKILSVGDTFLIIGAFVFFQEEMKSHKNKQISQVS